MDQMLNQRIAAVKAAGRDQRYGDTRCPDCGTMPGHYRHLN